MSTLKTNNVQVGQSVTATNNFTIYQPSSPDGTVRIGVGNSGATTADVASISSSGNFSFNSGYGSVATAYACRAWVNFNGTGTVAIRASGNVSSITDNGTGDYTVNFTTALPDANYSITAKSDSTNTNAPQGILINYSTVSNNRVAPTTSDFRIAGMVLSTGAAFDNQQINVSVFR
jgi:hypothetical protein